jgi:hypothetical protein
VDASEGSSTIGMATSERSDSLSYGASSFVSVEFSIGERCPLGRGNELVEFDTVTVDGGAGDDEVSKLIKTWPRSAMTPEPNGHTTTLRMCERFKSHLRHNMRVSRAILRAAGALRGSRW